MNSTEVAATLEAFVTNRLFAEMERDPAVFNNAYSTVDWATSCLQLCDVVGGRGRLSLAGTAFEGPRVAEEPLGNGLMLMIFVA